jgi:hypothetical protein
MCARALLALVCRCVIRFTCGDGLSLPSDLSVLFDDPYNAGVRIHSNSWG